MTVGQHLAYQDTKESPLINRITPRHFSGCLTSSEKFTLGLPNFTPYELYLAYKIYFTSLDKMFVNKQKSIKTE